MNVPGVSDVAVRKGPSGWFLTRHDKGDGSYPWLHLWPDLKWRRKCWDSDEDNAYYPSKDDAIQAAQMWWDRKQEGK
jgi:hypothetical protein